MKSFTVAFFILSLSIYPVFVVAEESVPSDENLLLQVKLLMTRGEGNPKEFDYMRAILDKIKSDSLDYEVHFYKSLVFIKSGNLNQAEIVGLLESASQGDHPLAIALLYKIYSEPFLIGKKHIDKAEALKTRYLDLYQKKAIPVGFDTALSAVNKMLLNRGPKKSESFDLIDTISNGNDVIGVIREDMPNHEK